MALITYEDAIRHLKLEGAEPDAQDIALKMEQATAIVIGLIDKPNHGWTVDTQPEDDSNFMIAQGFIFKVLGRLDRFRGDDEQKPEILTQSEQQLLANLLKDIALA